ncbi:MAG: EF-hand domain-containing protein [Proteobacteria bacterium]|nr:EF-hand domain-containing protein [Pseudomonadota bacterium]
MTKKTLPIILLLLGAVPALAVSALAAPGPVTDNPRPVRPSNSGVMRYDANKDGFVDRAEWNAGQETRFQQLDADKDGKLTKQELFAQSRSTSDRALERQEAFFRRMDTDHDGFVSKAEFMVQADKNFARCDLDRDDRINTAECRQALRRKPVDRAARQDR